MKKNLLKKLVPEVLVNTGAIWAVGKAANIISNSVFRFDLNKYNSVDHLIAGAGIGTIANRKIGRGVKGVAATFIAATAISAGWEWFENRYVFQTDLISIDTLTDFAAVYAGSMIPFLNQGIKKYINKRKEKWVL